jgi:hypothetical protein
VEREGGPAASQTHLEQAGPDGRTPFLLACAHGHTVVAQALLDAGADGDAADASGATAFTAACKTGQRKLARWLYHELGADPSHMETDGQTAFEHVVVNGDKQLTQWLVEVVHPSPASPEMVWNSRSDDGDTTPFFVACRHGQLRLAQYLHKCGFDCLHAAAGSGKSARTAALEGGHHSVVQWFDKAFAPDRSAALLASAASPARSRPGTAGGLSDGSPHRPSPLSTAGLTAAGIFDSLQTLSREEGFNSNLVASPTASGNWRA